MAENKNSAVIVITDSNDKKIVLGDSREEKSLIKQLDICFDTVDNDATRRDDDIIPRIIINCSLSSSEGTKIHEKMAELFSWSQGKGDSYRNVDISLYDNGKHVRSYHYTKMFVVDYEEKINYVAKKNSEEDISFIIKLNQRNSFIDDITSVPE